MVFSSVLMPRILCPVHATFRGGMKFALPRPLMRGIACSMLSARFCFLICPAILLMGCLDVSYAQEDPAAEKTFLEQAREAANKGDNTKAIKLYEMALQSALKVFKEDDLEVIMRRAELGEAYRAAGRWDNAIPQLDYVWKRLRFDADNKGRWLVHEGDICFGAAEKLGRALQGASRYDEAVMVFSTALADLEKSKRDEEEVINFDALLADTLFLLGKDEQAEKTVQHAQEVILRRYKDDPATKARLLSALGTLCYHHRRFERARIIAEQALLLAQQIQGIDPADYARYQDNLGAAYVQLGRLDEAEKLIAMARQEFLKKFTPDAPELMHVHLHMAEVLVRRHQLHDARYLTEEALRVARLNFPEQHPEVSKCLQNLASICLEQNQPGKASDLCAKALSINETALGYDHPRTQETRALMEKIQAELAKKP